MQPNPHHLLTGPQEVFLREDCQATAHLPAGMPVCRFERWEDPGDPDHGIPPFGGWQLSQDQVDTLLCMAIAQQETLALIAQLRAEEGDHVTLFCDNADFNGQPNCLIMCIGGWTSYLDKQFAGDTLLDCLRAAIEDKQRLFLGTSGQEPEQEQCGTTHYAGCHCHEKGWENKWKVAVEMAALAASARDQWRDRTQAAERTVANLSEAIGRMTDQNMEVYSAARATIERWDTPLWKDAPATANFINRLRDALSMERLALRREEITPETDDAACYPSDAGWWWIVGSDGCPVPVSVEKRGPRQVLSVCIPRCSTHCDKWWRPLKAIRGKWRGRVQLPLDNVKEPPTEGADGGLLQN